MTVISILEIRRHINIWDSWYLGLFFLPSGFWLVSLLSPLAAIFSSLATAYPCQPIPLCQAPAQGAHFHIWHFVWCQIPWTVYPLACMWISD